MQAPGADTEDDLEENFNDRVEELDASEGLRGSSQSPPRKNQTSAEKGLSSSAKRRRQPPADNLTPEQRQQ